MEPIEPDQDTEDSLVEHLAVAAEAAKIAQTHQDRLVRECRRRGIPWERISRSLGVSKQAAWGKYGERSS